MSEGDIATDVLIAGGGMVGASLAIALRGSGLRVALAEPGGLRPGQGPSFDERATALSWSTRQCFQSLGLWDAIAAGGQTIRHIHVSEQRRFGRVRLHADEIGADALGHVVPNRVIGEVLADHLSSQQGFDLIESAVAPAPEIGVEAARLQLEDGRRVQARLLVVADGAQSRMRDALKIAARTVDYGQRAIVANLETEVPHAGWAYERFTPAGPMALLPLGERRMNLVLTLDPEAAEDWMALDETGFLHRARERFGSHLGAFTRLGERHLYPLVQVRARELIARRVVLAGNAAIALHPVAGQGFNLALRGIADLARRLHELAGRQGDPGDASMLTAHAMARASDIRFTGGWTHLLAELFANDLPFAGRGRSLALLALDRVAPARRWFTRRAMGRMPGLAPLSRGVRD
jgi:2-octaprenyl-6-methoxyphenol hydroxylase